MSASRLLNVKRIRDKTQPGSAGGAQALRDEYPGRIEPARARTAKALKPEHKLKAEG
jgi:hypothetical protein